MAILYDYVGSILIFQGCMGDNMWSSCFHPPKLASTRSWLSALLACYLVAGHVTGADGLNSLGSLGRFDGSEIPRPTTVGCMKPLYNHGIFFPHINWWSDPGFLNHQQYHHGEKLWGRRYEIYTYLQSWGKWWYPPKGWLWRVSSQQYHHFLYDG